MEQLEKGKIKLDSIPQDQLNYLDLRTIDLSRMEVPEDIDLSALVLTGVNLSGVYIPKGHFLNMSLMAKQKARAKLIFQRTQRTIELMLQRIRQERQEKAKAFGEREKAKTQLVRLDALNDTRPKLKVKPTTSETEDKKESSVHLRSQKAEEKTIKETRHLSKQKRKVRTQKVHLKKRA